MWAFLGTIAVLQMWKIPAGFVTNYGADLLLPGYLYAAIRSKRVLRVLRPLGRSPWLTASAIFVACVAWEWGQNYGLDPVTGGKFDPFDIVAYGASLAVAYMVDLMIRRRSEP